MIHIRYKIDKDECILRVNGHAEYAPKGQDIVCAGVSALCMALYRAVAVSDTIVQCMTDDGVLDLRATEQGSDVRAMYAMAVLGFNEIAAQYPDFVQVEKIF